VPVNASLLPRTEEEHERCKRTVYVTNIDLGVEARRTLRLHLRHAVALTRGAARAVRGGVQLLRDAVRRGHAAAPHEAGQPRHASRVRGVLHGAER
jgi:hypothetical protein